MTSSITKEKQSQLPNFLVIGSQRCASTWLHQVLKEHPEITLAPKEYRFWSNKVRTESLDSYCQLFTTVSQKTPTKFRGEVDPSYAVMRPQEIAILKQLVPNLKVVLVIRNPVDRLISHITRQWTFYYVDKGASTSRNLFTLLRSVDSGLSYRFTDYNKIIENWSYFFSYENIHIELYENLNADSYGAIKRILSFLKADSEYVFQEHLFSKKINQSKIQEEEIPHLLKWYLSKKWLPKVYELESSYNLDLSIWTEQMKKIVSEGKWYYHLLVIIHYVYFVIPFKVMYYLYNLVRIPLKIHKAKKNLKLVR